MHHTSSVDDAQDVGCTTHAVVTTHAACVVHHCAHWDWAHPLHHDVADTSPLHRDWVRCRPGLALGTMYNWLRAASPAAGVGLGAQATGLGYRVTARVWSCVPWPTWHGRKRVKRRMVVSVCPRRPRRRPRWRRKRCVPRPSVVRKGCDAHVRTMLQCCMTFNLRLCVNCVPHRASTVEPL